MFMFYFLLYTLAGLLTLYLLVRFCSADWIEDLADKDGETGAIRAGMVILWPMVWVSWAMVVCGAWVRGLCVSALKARQRKVSK